MLAVLEKMPFFELLVIGASYIFLRWILVCSLFLLLPKIISRPRTIVTGNYGSTQFRSELIANFKSNVIDSLALPAVIYLGWIRFHPPEFPSVLAGFVFSYVFFEVWFYGIHRLLHTRRFRWIHRQHHLAQITSPLSALSLSVPEKFLNVIGMYLIPCLATHFFPLAYEGILTYHLVNFLVNVLGHCNFELLPKGHEATWSGRIFATSTYHSIHHSNGHRNFGLFTSLLDRVFGTYDRSYPDRYRRVFEPR